MSSAPENAQGGLSVQQIGTPLAVDLERERFLDTVNLPGRVHGHT